MKCNQCGFMNRAGAKFCRQCGRPLVVAPTPQRGARRFVWLAALVLVCMCCVLLTASGAYIFRDQLPLGQLTGSSVRAIAPELAPLGNLATVNPKQISVPVGKDAATIQLDGGVSIAVPANAFPKATQLNVTTIDLALNKIAYDVIQSKVYVVSTADAIGTLSAPVVIRAPQSTPTMTVAEYANNQLRPLKVKPGATTQIELTHFSKRSIWFFEWWSERNERLGTLVDEDQRGPLTREREKIEGGDTNLRAFYGVGEKAINSRDNLCDEFKILLSQYTTPANREFPKDSNWRNQELVQFLIAAKTPSAQGGYFWDATKNSMDEIRRNVLFKDNPVSPAGVLKIAIEANGGNVPLGILAAHNFLKETTYAGRDTYDGTGKLPEEHGKIAGRLQSWRQDSNVTPAGVYDKMGPLYHIFAAMTAGSFFPTGIAGDAAISGEAFLRSMRIGADRADSEKADADQCGADIASWLRQNQPQAPTTQTRRYQVALQFNKYQPTAVPTNEDTVRDFDYGCIPGQGLMNTQLKESLLFVAPDGTLSGTCNFSGSGTKSKTSTTGSLNGRVNFATGKITFTGKTVYTGDYEAGHVAAMPNAAAHYQKEYTYEGEATYTPDPKFPNVPYPAKGALKFTYRYSCGPCPIPYDKSYPGSFALEMDFRVAP